MPEGDAILWAATRMRPVLEGHVPDSIRTPHPRFDRDRWAPRLVGRRIEAIDTHGKNLFIRFAGDLVIYSHLRMTGSWRVLDGGRRWPESRAWLVLERAERAVVQLGGPVLELMTAARAATDPRLATLGPDVLAHYFDRNTFLARLRADDPTRGIGDALLDQRIVAGLGTIWRAEGCWAAGVDPWRRVADVSDDEAVAAVEGARPRMIESGLRGPMHAALNIYKKVGRPCPRCGAPIRARGQGDANRTTYWCPGCQH